MLIALLAGTFPLLAVQGKANEQFQFTHINTANSDISFDGISKIMQDSRGFIWIGTFKGLNRYDGTRFVTYYKEQLGLDSDFIHTIIEDKEGNLWIGTDTGVTRYIYDKATFERFDMVSDKETTPKNKITFLYCDADGKIWIVANYQGCFCYDPHTGTLTNYRDDPGTAPEYDTDGVQISFRRIVSDTEGGFFVSKYHNNLFRADGQMKNMQAVRPSNNPDYFLGDEVEQLFMLEGKLLVMSNLHGISLYDQTTNIVEELFRWSSNSTLVDAFLENGRQVWLCTTNGLWRYDLSRPEDGAIHIVENEKDRFSLSGNYVYTAFVDRDGDLWVGTKDGGISICGSFQKLIRKHYYASGETLSGAIMSGFAYDGNNTVWIGTEQNGLLKYKLSDGSTDKVDIPGIPTTVCSPVCDGNNLWFGSLDGLFRLDTESMKLRKYGTLERNKGVSDPKVYYCYRSKAGKLYFSNTLGLFEYLPESDSFRQINCFNGVFITCMDEDSKGNFWISSFATGLFVWNPQEDNLIANYRYGDGSGLPSDKIASVLTDKEDQVWVVGFSDGFAKMTDGQFVSYSTTSLPALPSNVYFYAIQDNRGDLWMTSDKGLVQFSPNTKQVSHYTSISGLLDNKMTRAMAILPSGEIFAGSDNGFVSFSPGDFVRELGASDVIVSKMRIGDLTVKGNVDKMTSIQLSPDQNSFGFQLSVMGLMSNAVSKVKVKLEGHDPEWRDITSQKSIYYFNVPSGEYNFRIMTSSNGAVWVENHLPIAIVIKRRFFASFYGICLLILLLAALSGITVFFMNRYQNRLRAKKEEEYKRASEASLMKDKMNFFSHVIHEIKTPLTLIQTPLHSVIAKDKLDDDARRDLKLMQNNTDYLTQLVNELLEFVRIERSGYVLNCESVDLTDVVNSLIFNYSEAARARSIRLEASLPEEHLWVSADRPALGKILNNLLINALKHSESFIKIRMTKEESGLVSIEISNDGDAIPKQMKEDIFKPFVQYKTASSGAVSGVGIGLSLARSLARMHSGDLVLADSEEDTVFRFTIPACDAPPTSLSHDEEADNSGTDDDKALILVVDDFNDLREFITRKLSEDYNIISAPDADSAMKLLREKNVDLMITDITMPGMSGLQMCKSIRADVELSHLPIIILSARTSVESKIEAMSCGADLYIEKPFDIEYLRSSVRNIIERRTLMRKAVNSGVGEVDITLFGLPKRDEDFFREFDRLVTENISDSNLSNEFLAEHLCMSVSTMIRKIRKLLNTSPNNYIRNKRLSLAARMIKDSHGNNITEICYSVGFSNVSYFAKCFREQYGVTPSEWAAS